MELSSSRCCCCSIPRSGAGGCWQATNDSGCENTDKTRHFAVGATVCSCSILLADSHVLWLAGVALFRENHFHCLLASNTTASFDITLPNAPIDDASRASDELLSRVDGQGAIVPQLSRELHVPASCCRRRCFTACGICLWPSETRAFCRRRREGRESSGWGKKKRGEGQGLWRCAAAGADGVRVVARAIE